MNSVSWTLVLDAIGVQLTLFIVHPVCVPKSWCAINNLVSYTPSTSVHVFIIRV